MHEVLHPVVQEKRERQRRMQGRHAQNKERNQKVVELYCDEGRTAQDIVGLLDLSRSVVYKALKEQDAIPVQIRQPVPEPPRFRRREPTEVVEKLLRLSRSAGRFT